MSDKTRDIELLESIDQNQQKILAKQSEIEVRLEEDKEERSAVAERVTSVAEKVEEHEKWLSEVEAKSNTARFGTGQGESDALRNLLPEAVRRQMAHLKASSESIKSHGKRPLGGDDEVQRAGIASWFMLQYQRAIASAKNLPERAAKYRESAEKIASALGGFHTKASLQEDTNDEGGFTVPTIVDTEIGAILRDNGVVRAAGPRVITMTSKDMTMPTRANAFSVALVNEEGTIGDSAPASPLGSGTLTAKKFSGLVTVSDELIQDNVVNLMDWLMSELLTEMARLEDTQALEGDGTGSNFTGLLAASGVTVVAKTPAGIAKADWFKLIYGAEEASTIDNGVAWVHPWIVRDLIQLEGTSTFVFPFLQQNNATPNSIGGTRTFRSAAISRTRGSGTEAYMYHGNPRGFVFGDRTGTQFNVDPFGLFTTAQVRLRLIKRTGILVWVGGYFTRHEDVQVAA